VSVTTRLRNRLFSIKFANHLADERMLESVNRLFDKVVMNKRKLRLSFYRPLAVQP